MGIVSHSTQASKHDNHFLLMDRYPRTQWSLDAERQVLKVIRRLSRGKRYLPRGVLRVWFENEESWGNTANHFCGPGSPGKRSSRLLKDFLSDLESKDYIRKFPGGIEILEN